MKVRKRAGVSASNTLYAGRADGGGVRPGLGFLYADRERGRRRIAARQTLIQKLEETASQSWGSYGFVISDSNHLHAYEPPSLLSAKAARKPRTAISPAKSCACSKASGIIVSTSIARIAPAAVAVVAATASGEAPRKSV